MRLEAVPGTACSALGNNMCLHLPLTRLSLAAVVRCRSPRQRTSDLQRPLAISTRQQYCAFDGSVTLPIAPDSVNYTEKNFSYYYNYLSNLS